MAINPVGHKILVEPDDVDDKLTHDFGDGKKFEIVSDKKIERTLEIFGTLVAAGDQAWKAFGKDFSGEPWAKIGDRVMFSQHAGRYVTDPETEVQYLIMNDEDINAVITGEA